MKSLKQLLEETGTKVVREATKPVTQVEALDVITPEHLYHHFDVDGDGVVTVEDYAAKILWHDMHPEKLEWIMGNMDGVHLEHATSDDSECAVSLHEDYDKPADVEDLDENVLPKGSLVPPAMLILKRIAIRQYPNGQKVALYFCKMINKYVTVPYNDNGLLSLSK